MGQLLRSNLSNYDTKWGPEQNLESPILRYGSPALLMTAFAVGREGCHAHHLAGCSMTARDTLRQQHVTTSNGEPTIWASIEQ